MLYKDLGDSQTRRNASEGDKLDPIEMSSTKNELGRVCTRPNSGNIDITRVYLMFLRRVILNILLEKVLGFAFP